MLFGYIICAPRVKVEAAEFLTMCWRFLLAHMQEETAMSQLGWFQRGGDHDNHPTLIIESRKRLESPRHLAPSPTPKSSHDNMTRSNIPPRCNLEITTDPTHHQSVMFIGIPFILGLTKAKRFVNLDPQLPLNVGQYTRDLSYNRDRDLSLKLVGGTNCECKERLFQKTSSKKSLRLEPGYNLKLCI